MQGIDLRRVVVLAAAALAVGCGPPPAASTEPTTSPTPPVTTAATEAPTIPTPSTEVPPTGTSEPVPPPSDELRPGANGPAVLELQRRLSDLGYWLGAPDGEYGDATAHAVVALQKAAGLDRDGVVGEATRAALDAGKRPAAASTAGHVVEIDLSRQLLLVVDDGEVQEIFDTSTGRAAGTTPRGHWSVEREIDGFRRSPLGLLYRPKYFHGGVAIHGYTSVPAQAASHGCVRVTYAAADHLWAASLAPVGTPVWVY